eukprot:5043000-Amphidinium_carterae.1
MKLNEAHVEKVGSPGALCFVAHQPGLFKRKASGIKTVRPLRHVGARFFSVSYTHLTLPTILLV